MNLKYQKSFRLLSRSDFLSLRDGSTFLFMNSLLIYHKKNLNDYTRLGIAVSKKIGKANIRNRYKRIIKEYFRKSEFKELSLDVLVVMNPKRYKQLSTSEIEFEHIMLNDLESSFKKIVQDHVNL